MWLNSNDFITPTLFLYEVGVGTGISVLFAAMVTNFFSKKTKSKVKEEEHEDVRETV